MHVGIANPRWRGKSSRHSRLMDEAQFYVSGNRPMENTSTKCTSPDRSRAPWRNEYIVQLLQLDHRCAWRCFKFKILKKSRVIPRLPSKFVSNLNATGFFGSALTYPMVWTRWTNGPRHHPTTCNTPLFIPHTTQSGLTGRIGLKPVPANQLSINTWFTL